MGAELKKLDRFTCRIFFFVHKSVEEIQPTECFTDLYQ